MKIYLMKIQIYKCLVVYLILGGTQHRSCGARGDTTHILLFLAHGQTALSQPLESGMIMGFALGTEMGVEYFTF